VVEVRFPEAATPVAELAGQSSVPDSGPRLTKTYGKRQAPDRADP
jgi:hypothetical protein